MPLREVLLLKDDEAISHGLTKPRDYQWRVCDDTHLYQSTSKISKNHLFVLDSSFPALYYKYKYDKSKQYLDLVLQIIWSYLWMKSPRKEERQV